MHFIRLPGCSVGQYLGNGSPIPILPTQAPAWQCQTFAGQAFWCDTDFRRKETVTGEELLDETWEEHICLTGGEPLMHKEVVQYLLDQARLRQKLLHIETSGTIDWKEANKANPWVTVSPKAGYLPSMIRWADEVKLLVHPEFDKSVLSPQILAHATVFLSPINNVGSGSVYHPDSRKAFKRCMELLKDFPHWRLTTQLHKYLGVE